MTASGEFNSERRQCVRQKIHVPAFASFDGVTGGMILDLSEEGMAMQAAAPLELRRKLNLQLDLTEPSAVVETTGYIAWADALGRAGVRFSELPEDGRRRLKRWLTLNADAPSRMAPKLKVRSGSAESWPERLVAPKNKPEHVSLSLEADSEAAGDESWKAAIAIPQTMQYEFNSLGTDLNAVLRVIGERARTLTRGTSAAIALARNGSVQCRASIGRGAPAFGARLDVNFGFSGECFRTGKSLRCDDTETDTRVDVESCRIMGVRSILAAPIRSDREVIGLLAVFGENTFSFDEGDVAVVETLAHTLLLALKQIEAPKIWV